MNKRRIIAFNISSFTFELSFFNSDFYKKKQYWVFFYSQEQTFAKGKAILDLSTNSLTGKTCAVLGKALASDRTFIELKFGDCMLSEDGECCMSLLLFCLFDKFVCQLYLKWFMSWLNLLLCNQNVNIYESQKKTDWPKRKLNEK